MRVCVRVRVSVWGFGFLHLCISVCVLELPTPVVEENIKDGIQKVASIKNPVHNHSFSRNVVPPESCLTCVNPNHSPVIQTFRHQLMRDFSLTSLSWVMRATEW